MPRDKRSAQHVTSDERGGTDDFAPATVIAVAKVRGSQKFVKCEDDKTSRQAGSAFGIALLSQRGRIRRMPAKYRSKSKVSFGFYAIHPLQPPTPTKQARGCADLLFLCLLPGQ